MNRRTWLDLHGDQGDLGRDAAQAEAEHTARAAYEILYEWFGDLLEVELGVTDNWRGFSLRRSDTGRIIDQWDW
jgi:hypothetical protein